MRQVEDALLRLLAHAMVIVATVAVWATWVWMTETIREDLARRRDPPTAAGAQGLWKEARSLKTVKAYQKPPHLIAYFEDEAQKKMLQDLAHTLDLSASELLKLLALPAAAQVRALLAKGANPRAVAKRLRERVVNGGAGR